MSKGFKPLLALFLLVALFSSCGRHKAGFPVSKIVIEPDRPVLRVGQTKQMTATAFDASGGVLFSSGFLWSSSNPSVATVDANGLVTAVAAGDDPASPAAATIRASSEGVTGETVVFVSGGIDSIEVLPKGATIAVGGRIQFIGVARDAAGNLFTDVQFEWRSDKENVATIDQSGLAQGTGPGATLIFARAEGKEAFATLQVGVGCTPQGASDDQTRPEVTQIFPANLQTGVDPSTDIRVVFSENIEPKTITTSTIILVGGGRTVETCIPGSLGCISGQPGGTLAILHPLVKLTPDTEYTVIVTSGVTDLACNPLIDFVSTFRTRTSPDNTPPSFPGGLTVKITSSTAVLLSFPKAHDDVTPDAEITYIVSVTPPPAPPDQVFKAGGDPTVQVPISGLSPSTIYTFTVTAVDASGNRSSISAQGVTFSAAEVGFVRLVGPKSGDFSVDGAVPQSVATADFDLDGRDDLAVANLNSNSVSVLFGPDFTLLRSKTGLTKPSAVIAADFNSDGKSDLAVANYQGSGQGTVTIFFGDGTREFSSQPPCSISTGDNPTALVASDFNQDGRLDLAAASEAQNRVFIHLQNPPPCSFRTDLFSDVGTAPNSIATADFNSDSRPDLVVGNRGAEGTARTATVLFNGSPAGTFGPGTTLSPETTGLVTAVTPIDYNRDGKVDIAIAATDGKVFLFKNNGDQTFSVDLNCSGGGSCSLGSSSVPIAMTALDVNRDGRVDLMTANNGTGAVSILLAADAEGPFRVESGFTFSLGSGARPRAIGLGDFSTGGKVDGKPDLVVVNSFCESTACTEATGTVSILINASKTFGDSAFALAAAVSVAVQAKPTGVVAGDLNGDGDADLATANESAGSISIRENNGSGAFNFAVTPEIGSGLGSIHSVALADINLDGRLDLIGAYAGASGNPTSATSTTVTHSDQNWPVDIFKGAVVTISKACVGFPFDPTTCGTRSSTITGNSLNSFTVSPQFDVTPDNTWRYNVDRGYLTLHLGNQNLTFGSALTLNAGVRSEKVALADLNRDGRPDLVSANEGEPAAPFNDKGNLKIFYGTGSFPWFSETDSASVDTCPTIPCNPSGVAIGDFNADGRLDLAASNNNGGSVSVMLQGSDGLFAVDGRSPYLVGSHPPYIAAADLNRDGKIDLVTANDDSGSVSLLLGNGDGSFRYPPVPADSPTWCKAASGITGCAQIAVLRSPHAVAIADYNGDGQPDVGLITQQAAEAYILFGKGDGTFGPDNGTSVGQTFSTGPSPAFSAHGISTADFNGDGKPDLVTANQGKSSSQEGNTLSVLINATPVP